MTKLGLKAIDFEVFGVEGFGARMEKIYEHVRPKLTRLGAELAPELSSKLKLELHPHLARHTHRKPPPESWVAFGPSPQGYKRYGYLALCISRAGLHARAVVNARAESRAEMARGVEAGREHLVKAFKGTKVARYEKWDYARLPVAAAAESDFFDGVAHALGQKTGAVDMGFGWTVSESLRLERGEVIEAFRELEPLYRVFTSGFCPRLRERRSDE